MNSNAKTKNMNFLARSALMLVACILLASNASADDQIVRTVTVTYTDLNVDTPAGVQALYGRIHSAAKRVCFDSSKHLEDQVAVDACAERAEAQAVKKLNLPTLTAYYQMKTSNHTTTRVATR
jgi:UrcA family protein